MSGLWAEDNDSRAGEMVADPAGYFSAARVRAERETVSEVRKPATLGPGIVEMSLRGTDRDVEWILTAIRDAGGKAWRADSRGTRSGNQAGYQYFSAEVPRDIGE